MPRDINAVAADLADTDCGDVPELHIRTLARALADDESVTFAIFGKLNTGYYDLLAITPMRIVSITAKTSWLGKEEAVTNAVLWRDALNVTSRVINSRTGNRWFNLTGYSNQQISAHFQRIYDVQFQAFVQAVSDHIVQAQSASYKPRVRPATAKPSTGLTDELERLGTIKQQGLLTDAEFQAAKRKLLA